MPHSHGLLRGCLTAMLFPVLVLGAARRAGAQGADSARVAARRSVAPADTVKPPLSPRRAFLYSLALPGYAQSVLGRHKAAAILLGVEAMSIAMIRESAADVREARRMRGDSLVLSYVDPQSGGPAPVLAVPRRFDADYVRARQNHVEDWIALLIANHLFAGADAFVAANLWDVPAQLSVRASRGGATLAARVSW